MGAAPGLDQGGPSIPAWRQRLGFQIAEWERSGRDAGTLLRGALLREARRFARSRRDDLNDREREFLARSESQSRRRLLGIGVITILAILGVIEFYRNQRASALFESIQTAEIGEVPRLVNHLTPYRSWANPWLARSLRESKEDTKEHLNSSLALLPVDANQVDFLFSRLLAASPTELPVIRVSLKPHQASLVPKLWSTLDSAKPSDVSLLRAASALADYDPDNSRWESVGGKVAQALVSVNPVFLPPWVIALRPVRGKLKDPLATIFQDKKRSDFETRAGDGDPDRLRQRRPEPDRQPPDGRRPQGVCGVLPYSPDGMKQRPCLCCRRRSPRRQRYLTATTRRWSRIDWRERQARAAVALLRMGKSRQEVMPLLRHSADPRLRSFIVNWLNPLGADPKLIAAELDRIDPSAKPMPAQGQQKMDAILFHPETSQRRALILALGTYGTEGLSAGEREPLTNKLLDLYRNDPDSGIHGAAEWTLRQWKHQEKLRELDAQLMKVKDRGDRRWFMNSQGQPSL